MWLFYAAGSAFFAGVTSVLAKCGIRRTDPTVATAVRTVVILVFSWGIALTAGSAGQLLDVSGRTFLFLILSGAATGASWLCYYRALQEGPASIVAPVDKLSVLVTAVFSYFVFGERLSRRSGAGLALLTAGTAAMALL
nr:EamA family transporter [uncultured Lachnoclostridium sp.]